MLHAARAHQWIACGRWLEAAAVSTGKERLDYLAMHVVEVRHA